MTGATTSARPTIRAGEALLVAVTTALLAGAAQSAWVMWRVLVMHQFSWATRDIAWMAPVSYAAVILPATLLALLLVRRWPRIVPARLAIVTPVTVALFGVLILIRAIHPLALLAVAVGLGIQLAYLYTTHQRRAVVLTRYVGLAVAALLLGASALVHALPAITEARARTAAASPADRPNVLLIILDTVRASNMGLFGYARANTPQLARLANEGVRFTRAIAPASWTLPSHVSLFTGLDTRAAVAGWQRSLDDSVVTLAEVLGQRGWLTGGFAANTHYTTWETGLAQGFHHWDDFDVSLGEALWASSLAQITLFNDFFMAGGWPGRWRAIRAFDLRVPRHLQHVRRPAAEIVDRFLEWQASVQDAPFFGFLNLFDAHDPYVEPPGWMPQYAPGRSDVDTYDSAIAYMDDQLGRLFETLRQRGVLDRTIVIVTSDHGEQFGEHGLVNHGNSLYLNTIHVPLLLRAPRGSPAGVSVDEPVSLTDVPATVLDLAGLNPAELRGQSLRLSWEGPPADSAHAVAWIEQHPRGRKGDPATAGPMTSIVDAQYHWIRHADGRNELYAYRSDSLETMDRQADASMSAVIAMFLRRAGLSRQP